MRRFLGRGPVASTGSSARATERSRGRARRRGNTLTRGTRQIKIVALQCGSESLRAALSQKIPLGVDDKAADARCGNALGDQRQLGIDPCTIRAQTDIGPTIRQQHEDDVGHAATPRLCGDLEGAQERCRERSTATRRHLVDGTPQQLHAARGRQQQVGVVTSKSKQRYTIAVDVGLFEQCVHGALGLAHAVECHAATGIDCKKE